MGALSQAAAQTPAKKTYQINRWLCERCSTRGTRREGHPGTVPSPAPGRLGAEHVPRSSRLPPPGFLRLWLTRLNQLVVVARLEPRSGPVQVSAYQVYPTAFRPLCRHAAEKSTAPQVQMPASDGAKGAGPPGVPRLLQGGAAGSSNRHGGPGSSSGHRRPSTPMSTLRAVQYSRGSSRDFSKQSTRYGLGVCRSTRRWGSRLRTNPLGWRRFARAREYVGCGN